MKTNAIPLRHTTCAWCCKTQTLDELAGASGLEKCREQFEELFYALKKVHENEVRLTQKCRQLNDEIADNVARVSAVLEMTQEEEMVTAVVRQVRTHTAILSPHLTGPTAFLCMLRL